MLNYEILKYALNQTYCWVDTATRNASCNRDSEHQSQPNAKGVNNEVFCSILKFDAQDYVYKNESANHFRYEEGVVHACSIASVIWVHVRIIWT